MSSELCLSGADFTFTGAWPFKLLVEADMLLDMSELDTEFFELLSFRPLLPLLPGTLLLKESLSALTLSSSLSIWL